MSGEKEPDAQAGRGKTPAATDECGPKSTPLHSHIKAERENEPKAPRKR